MKGQDVEIRAPSPQDADRLERFFARVPPSDRTFFKEDVRDPAVVEQWTGGSGGSRALALGRGGAVLAAASVVPLSGWSDHVAELRLVVDARHRRRRLGTTLARWALLEAVRMGSQKVVVEVLADQEPAIAMFQGLGFVPEALLRDHVRGRDGKLHDLLLLAHAVRGNWSQLATLGMEAE